MMIPPTLTVTETEAVMSTITIRVFSLIKE